MNVDTGEIYNADHDEMMESLLKHGEMVDDQDKRLLRLTAKQAHTIKPMTKESRKNYMRNQPCVCGSGNKFKKCCWNSYSHKKEIAHA